MDTGKDGRMFLRIIGATLTIAGCAGVGCIFALYTKRETIALKSIIRILDYWTNELSFRITPLPDLCRQASVIDNTIIGRFFLSVAEHLEKQTESNVENCIITAISEFPDFPIQAKPLLVELGKSLGRFDLSGQLREIERVLQESKQLYQHHINNQAARLRNYKTLGICAGAAIVILFI